MKVFLGILGVEWWYMYIFHQPKDDSEANGSELSTLSSPVSGGGHHGEPASRETTDTEAAGEQSGARLPTWSRTLLLLGPVFMTRFVPLRDRRWSGARAGHGAAAPRGHRAAEERLPFRTGWVRDRNDTNLCCSGLAQTSETFLFPTASGRAWAMERRANMYRCGSIVLRGDGGIKWCEGAGR